MQVATNIYLIGLMGSGKTTIGKQLATTLQLPFYDSDKVIVEQTGVDIATIFAYEGEQGFRVREQNMLQKLTQINGIVLATGGGAVLAQANRQMLQKNGFVVYLQCTIDTLLQRTYQNKQRPLLNNNNPRSVLEKLLLARNALYVSCADFKIDTDNMNRDKVAQDILNAYQSV